MGIAERFYDAFSVADHHSMGLMYAPTATFTDPVFPMLSGPEAALMWEMLLTRSKDFSVSFNVREDESRAKSSGWRAIALAPRAGRSRTVCARR